MYPHTIVYLLPIGQFCFRYLDSLGIILGETELLLFVATWLVLGNLLTSSQL